MDGGAEEVGQKIRGLFSKGLLQDGDALTRRELLSLLLIAAVAGSGCPGPAGLKAVQAARPDFERIDCHVHVHENCPPIIAGLGAAGWRALTICVCGGVGNEPYDIEGLLQKTAKLHRESKGRIAWAATFDARGWESPDFTDRVTASLSRAFDEGAVGVKIWKNIGMAIRSRKTGEYLKPDNAALMPIYDSMQRADRTLLVHVADPNNSFLPSPEWRQLYRRLEPSPLYHHLHPVPLWWQLYGRPGAPDNWWNFEQHPGSPPKEELLLSRDRILASHSKLRVVGCHLGSNSEDLGALAHRLDTYPNFAVDLAASVQTLANMETNTVRQFLVRYQDRVLYGSDVGVLNDEAQNEESWKGMNAKQEREWNYFASREKITFEGSETFVPVREVQSLGLSESVLRKIFHENPRLWLPGIDG